MADARPLSRPETAAWQAAEQDPQNWVRALRSAPGDRDAARARLHELLLQAARSEAKRRWSATAAPEEPKALAAHAATPPAPPIPTPPTHHTSTPPPTTH